LDKISVRHIHECADLIADSLCSIFNWSIATGIFPEDWKISKIILLFKGGLQSVLRIGSAHNKGRLLDFKIVQISHVLYISEHKH
jgi:hypothetical protein